MENNNVISLIKLAINEIKKQKIILPGITTIEKIVSEAISKADEKIFKSINDSITSEQKYKLDMILISNFESRKTKLGWLKEDIGYSSPKSFGDVIERLEFIRNLNLKINLLEIHQNRIR